MRSGRTGRCYVGSPETVAQRCDDLALLREPVRFEVRHGGLSHEALMSTSSCTARGNPRVRELVGAEGV